MYAIVDPVVGVGVCASDDDFMLVVLFMLMLIVLHGRSYCLCLNPC